MSSLDASLASSKSTPCSSLDHQPQSQDQQQPLNANSCSCSCPGNNANSGSSDQEPQHCSTPKKNNLNNNNQSITSQSEGEESGMKKTESWMKGFIFLWVVWNGNFLFCFSHWRWSKWFRLPGSCCQDQVSVQGALRRRLWHHQVD